jgi:WD40 repeat protein
LKSGENWQDETKIILNRTPWSLSWSGDSRRLAYNSTEAYVYDVEEQTSLSFECTDSTNTDHVIYALALSPDGKYLIADNGNGGGTCLWDVDTQALIPLSDAQKISFWNVSINGLAWNPDSKRLAIVRVNTRYVSETQTYYSELEVWDMFKQEQLALIELPATMTDIAWSPDGTRLAAADNDGLIHIWQQP